MTPLAQRLARALMSNKFESSDDKAFQGLVSNALRGGHFFDMTNAAPLFPAVEGAFKQRGYEGFQAVAFLPAPNTWVEWLETTDKTRHAVSMQEKTLDWDGAAIRCIEMTYFDQKPGRGFGALQAGGIRTDNGERFLFTFKDTESVSAKETRSRANAAAGVAAIFLAIINSPRIIGQRKHAPHKGLMRDLARSSVDLGKVHDWTEILLEVTKPRDIYDGEEHSDIITGRRALHFCRRHIRILSSGRLTYVTAHWRGDPALGIKQSTYTVAP